LFNNFSFEKRTGCKNRFLVEKIIVSLKGLNLKNIVSLKGLNLKNIVSLKGWGLRH